MSRTTQWLLGAAGLALALVAGAADVAQAAAPQAVRVYIGTYTGPKSKGIYQMQLDLATGALSAPELAGEVANPSFVAIHPTNKFVYAVSEAGGNDATVSAFAVAPETGKLTFLNKQPARGSGPCYVSVDKTGKAALAANYNSGSICAMPIGADGQLAEATAAIQHAGSGPNAARQKGPHAHCIDVDPTNHFVLSCDLGLDKVLVYRFDAAKATLVPNDPPSASVAPGSGPRHIAFHPNGKFVYVISELANTVTAFAYDGQRGTMSQLGSVSTLPAEFDGRSSTAEIEVHPSGKFLYGSNRGHDSIAIFAVAADGKLKPLGQQPTQGKNPRCFGIDPSGTWLLAANQDSGNVVVFRIDAATGLLKASGATAAVSAPVCVKFMPMP
ncbi:MAG: lactonase family protein [Planctomycetota bacterium]|nr:lactonase family protein [Planctomycetota bacterium]